MCRLWTKTWRYVTIASPCCSTSPACQKVLWTCHTWKVFSGQGCLPLPDDPLFQRMLDCHPQVTGHQRFHEKRIDPLGLGFLGINGVAKACTENDGDVRADESEFAG